MPEVNYKHIRVRDPKLFSRFRVIKDRGRLCSQDQKTVRAKIGRRKALYTVGKFKEKHKGKAPKGKRGEPLAWGLQKIMVPLSKSKKGGGKVGKKKRGRKKGKKKGKKWGKIGSPKSAKRKRYLAKIRPK